MSLRETIIEAIRTIKDPEIPINIYDLGLIYDIDVNESGVATITMTLTTPNCPVAEALPTGVRTKVGELPGVSEAHVKLVFDPPWSPEKMSEDAKLALDYAGPGGFEALKSRDPFTNLTVRRSGGGPSRSGKETY
jgi:FeS assembly SUF system protein